MRNNLARAKALRMTANADPGAARDRLRLRAWQSARLAASHGDLLRSERYSPAANFFLNELYGPKDFSSRDEEVERILPTLVAVLPASGVKTVALAVELDALSEELDAAMVAELRNRGAIAAIDGAAYAAAYRASDNRPARESQIELIRQTGEALDALARKRLVRVALRLMATPAHLAGLGELHEFLQSGFDAFSHMGGAEDFLRIVVQRENALLERLFAGEENPFIAS